MKGGHDGSATQSVYHRGLHRFDLSGGQAAPKADGAEVLRSMPLSGQAENENEGISGDRADPVDLLYHSGSDLYDLAVILPHPGLPGMLVHGDDPGDEPEGEGSS